MTKSSDNYLRRLAVVALSLIAAGTLQAQYVEVGDAGVTLGSAQSTGPVSGVGLPSITGTILNGFDGDFFYITITNPTIFSATTVGGSSMDTMLYLFTLNGNPVYLNDDAPSGTSLQSTLPPGHPFGPLSIGTYIIGISLSGAEPVNVGNQPLFADGVFSTDIRGPRAGALGPVNGITGATSSETGLYTIMLTGAATSAIPEPGTVALLACSGLVGLVAWRRRVRKADR